MKKLIILMAVFALCLTFSGCGDTKEPAPDELQTPQYSVTAPEEFTPPAEEEIHTSEDGVKVIAPSKASTSEASVASSDDTRDAEPSATVANHQVPAAITPETVWADDAVVTYNAFTMPEMAAFDDGSIGVLSIGKIGLSVNVYESDDQMEDMSRGIAHFKSTSAWDGNVALSGHNRTASGYGAYFQNLYMLEAGDAIIYRTALGERQYVVSTVKVIDETDWSALGRTTENRLSLITCVNDNATKRLLVQAVQA